MVASFTPDPDTAPAEGTTPESRTLRNLKLWRDPDYMDEAVLTDLKDNGPVIDRAMHDPEAALAKRLGIDGIFVGSTIRRLLHQRAIRIIADGNRPLGIELPTEAKRPVLATPQPVGEAEQAIYKVLGWTRFEDPLGAAQLMLYGEACPGLARENAQKALDSLTRKGLVKVTTSAIRGTTLVVRVDCPNEPVWDASEFNARRAAKRRVVPVTEVDLDDERLDEPDGPSTDEFTEQVSEEVNSMELPAPQDLGDDFPGIDDEASDTHEADVVDITSLTHPSDAPVEAAPVAPRNDTEPRAINATWLDQLGKAGRERLRAVVRLLAPMPEHTWQAPTTDIVGKALPSQYQTGSAALSNLLKIASENSGVIEQRVDGKRRRWLRATPAGIVWALTAEAGPVVPSTVKPPASVDPATPVSLFTPAMLEPYIAPGEPRLDLAPTCQLDLDIMSRRVAVMGKSGSGKTSTAWVIIEELIACGQPVAVIDPMGVCWGLKCSADGMSEGLPILVIGGDPEHRDMSISPRDGRRLAEMFVRERISMVFDVSEFEDEELFDFTADFYDRLYRLKQADRRPVFVVYDEADKGVPQHALAGTDKYLLEAAQQAKKAALQVAKKGRQWGIGQLWISQRPAEFHKGILGQVEAFIALSFIQPIDVKVVVDWFANRQGSTGKLAAQLGSLQVGQALFYAPTWLGDLRCIQVRPRHTFDSTATPKPGEDPPEPQVYAKADTAVLDKYFPGRLGRDQEADATEEEDQEYTDPALEALAWRGISPQVTGLSESPAGDRREPTAPLIQSGAVDEEPDPAEGEAPPDAPPVQVAPPPISSPAPAGESAGAAVRLYDATVEMARLTLEVLDLRLDRAKFKGQRDEARRQLASALLRIEELATQVREGEARKRELLEGNNALSLQLASVEEQLAACRRAKSN